MLVNQAEIIERIEGVSTSQLLQNFDNACMEIVELPKEWLPEDYQQKRPRRSLRAIDNQYRRENKAEFRDPHEVSVKFDNQQNIVQSTNERLSKLEQYAQNVANGQDIEYQENERKLYANQIAFAKVMVETGVFDVDEFEME